VTTETLTSNQVLDGLTRFQIRIHFALRMSSSQPTQPQQPGSFNAHFYPHPHLQVPNTAAFPYYGHPNWQGQPWPLNGYPYPQQHPYQPTQFQQYQPPPQVSSSPRSSVKKKTRLRSPSPSPPPKEFPRHWDAALKTFFLAVGLSQCLAGLEADILVMNPDWEEKVVPEALRDLQSSISVCLSAFEPRVPDVR
jgi:hypothetical protein